MKLQKPNSRKTRISKNSKLNQRNIDNCQKNIKKQIIMKETNILSNTSKVGLTLTNMIKLGK